MTEQPLTVCYNGECAICRHEIESYQRMAKEAGVEVAWRDIATDQAILTDLNVTENEVARRLHVVADGKMLTGVEAFAAIWSKLPRLRRFAPMLDWPLVRPIAHLAYERLAAPALFALHLRRRRRRAKQ